MDTTVPFRSPIQMTLFLPFQNGENAIFTAETFAQQNGPIFAKQALIPRTVLELLPKRNSAPINLHRRSAVGLIFFDLGYLYVFFLFSRSNGTDLREREMSGRSRVFYWWRKWPWKPWV